MISKTTTYLHTEKQNGFLTSRMFLAIVSCVLIALSVLLWKTQEAHNLNQLRAYTMSVTKSTASDAEILYLGNQKAVVRLANKGMPTTQTDLITWRSDAAFIVTSFTGVKQIALIDTDLFVRTVFPEDEGTATLNEKATDLKASESELKVWLPMYSGTKLEGFLLEILDIHTFNAPLLRDLTDDFMIQITNEDQRVFVSDNWMQPDPDYTVDQSYTLQDTVILTLTLSPTQQKIASTKEASVQTLLISLLFSLITVVAIYFAQRYNALSKLNESRFRLLLEDAELVAVILDMDGNVTYCNPYLLSLTGYSQEEVLGNNWFELFTIKSTQEQLLSYWLDMIAEGDFISHHENRIITKQGDYRWIMFSNTLLRDTRGNIIGVASLGQDITERRQAQQALVESEARYRSVIAVAGGVAYEYDWQSETYPFMEANIEQYLGYTPEEITPAFFKKLILENVNDTESEALGPTQVNSTVSQLPYRRADLRLQKKDGSSIWMMDCAVRIRDEQGNVVRTIGMLQNISVRKQHEARLKMALTDKETLLQELYHRTKNNMQVIISMIELQSTYYDDPRLHAIFNDTKNRILSMSLVHKKLYQSQNLSSIDLAEYIRELATLLLNGYQTTPGRISMVFQMESIPVLIDTAVPCGLVLNELVTNALKYAYPAPICGSIYIYLQRLNEHEIELRVADDGIGFTNDFDPRHDGSMGLQTVFGIAEHQLQSQISYTSSKGVTWIIQFSDSLYQPRV